MSYQLNIRMDWDLADRLASYSQTSGVPRNTIVVRALAAWLDEQRGEPRTAVKGEKTSITHKGSPRQIVVKRTTK